MPSVSPDAAVRNYLAALRDPSSLVDEKKITELERRLESSGDELERLKLRQQLHDARRPNLDTYEDAFIEHAKGWAEAQGVGEKAFLEEGVAPSVLRRAGFRTVTAAGRRRPGGTRRPRSRVSSDAVRAAIPKTQFTIKQLQERSGASPAIVRRIVQEEEAAGRLKAVGTDRSQKGPGRTPTLYKVP